MLMESNIETRPLVHIERVESVTPIPNADRIELVQVLGWQCIVAKKDGLKVGDKCIYIEIDSIVPEWPVFEFLRPYKFRVRTIKLRGQVSQGLCLPITPEVLEAAGLGGTIFDLSLIPLGTDLTQTFKVRKYDPQGDKETLETSTPNNNKRWAITSWFMKFNWFRWIYFIFNKGKERYPWPEWISHTDEPRVQNNPGVYLHTEDLCYCSEKLDGQSCTLFITQGKRSWNKADYGVCSRNKRLDPKTPRGSWPKIYERCETQMRKALALEFPQGFAVQGEIIGPGIQKNKYQRKDYEFYVFNVILTNGKRLSLHSFEDFCKRYGFVTVPILERALKVTQTLSEILEYARGNSVLAGVEVMREGVVIRSWDQSVSFKVINNEFLLAEKDEDEEPAKEIQNNE